MAVEYGIEDRVIVRTATAGRFASTSRLPFSGADMRVPGGGVPGGVALARVWNTLQLSGKRPHLYRGPDRLKINIVDLFCGCGGLSLGIKQAAEAVGLRPVFSLAVDVDRAALEVYVRNLRPLRYLRQNVRNLIDRFPKNYHDQRNGDTTSFHMSDSLNSVTSNVDIFIAGPPCEGNSNLNNWTRRFDHRNELYLDAVAVGIALKAGVIVVENVPAVRRSRQNVVDQSLRLLQSAGYRIDRNEFVLTASDFGTPQERRRHFLIAGKSARTVQAADFEALKFGAPTVSEIIGPLSDIERRTTFDRPSTLSRENRKRVEFLVDEGRYDLPDDKRPDCHRLRSHTYPAVYGRMHPGRVAPTITTGFLSPGRGRFTHPFEARSLTPHEGARLQGFGEEFNWLPESGRIARGDYASMIGAAVPPQLGFAAGMCALSTL